MKSHSTGILKIAAASLAGGILSTAHAGTVAAAPTMTAPPVEDDSVVSGSLSFDLNSHFVSYGWDVWGGGRSFGGDSTFNPSLELNWALTDNFTAILGTWWDVNNNLGSAIGGDLQEIDVWAGGSYAFGDFSVTALYQAWIYGGDTEHILDVSFAYDTFLSPSLTIHNRLDNGAALGDTGTVIVPGIEYGFDLGPVSFAIPVSAGFFLDDGFHGTTFLAPIATNADSGFGYVSIGLNASYALPIDEKFGEWDIHGGVTYYDTQNDVIPINTSDTFFTWNVGIGCSF